MDAEKFLETQIAAARIQLRAIKIKEDPGRCLAMYWSNKIGELQHDVMRLKCDEHYFNEGKAAYLSGRPKPTNLSIYSQKPFEEGWEEAKALDFERNNSGHV